MPRILAALFYIKISHSYDVDSGKHSIGGKGETIYVVKHSSQRYRHPPL